MPKVAAALHLLLGHPAQARASLVGDVAQEEDVGPRISLPPLEAVTEMTSRVSRMLARVTLLLLLVCFCL